MHLIKYVDESESIQILFLFNFVVWAILLIVHIEMSGLMG